MNIVVAGCVGGTGPRPAARADARDVPPWGATCHQAGRHGDRVQPELQVHISYIVNPWYKKGTH